MANRACSDGELKIIARNLLQVLGEDFILSVVGHNGRLNETKDEDMVKVTAKNATESECHQWSTEASDLQIPPGRVFRSLETDLGNGQPFELVDWDHARATYQQAMGCLRLAVFND